MVRSHDRSRWYLCYSEAPVGPSMLCGACVASCARKSRSALGTSHFKQPQSNHFLDGRACCGCCVLLRRMKSSRYNPSEVASVRPSAGQSQRGPRGTRSTSTPSPAKLPFLVLTALCFPSPGRSNGMDSVLKASCGCGCHSVGKFLPHSWHFVHARFLVTSCWRWVSCV